MSTHAVHHHPMLAKAGTVLIVEGVLLAILGVLGLAAPVVTGIAVAVFVGFLLIVGGLAGIAAAFLTKPHVHFWWSLLSGVVAIAAGAVALLYPPAAIVGLTVVIAAWLAAFLMFLPAMAAAVALGVIVGMGLLFRGIGLTSMGLALRRKA